MTATAATESWRQPVYIVKIRRLETNKQCERGDIQFQNISNYTTCFTKISAFLVSAKSQPLTAANSLIPDYAIVVQLNCDGTIAAEEWPGVAQF